METIGRAQSEDSPDHVAGPGDGERCPADAALFHHRRRPEADSARTQISLELLGVPKTPSWTEGSSFQANTSG